MGTTPRSMAISRKFATILSWPQEQRAEQVAATLQRAGYGGYEANQLVKRDAPFLLGRVQGEWVKECLPQLLNGGVKAVVFAQEQMESVPAPMQAKSLVAAIGAPKAMYAVEAWRGAGTSLVMDEVFLIVRASVGKTKTTVESAMRSGLGRAGVLIAPELVIAHELSKTPATLGSSPRVTVHGAAEVVELYRLDGTRIRVNSEKFSFDVLGSDRSLTDRASVDTLMLKLSEQAQNAEIDLHFGKFRAPADTIKTHSSVGVAGASVKSTDMWPSFEFYSQWRYLIQRVRCGLEP